MSKLQTVFLQNLPAIPLWYNGMWAMFNTKYWTNWPSAKGGQYTPTAWSNYWQMTSIDMLTHLKPTKQVASGTGDRQHPSRRRTGRGVAVLSDDSDRGIR